MCGIIRSVSEEILEGEGRNSSGAGSRSVGTILVRRRSAFLKILPMQ
jgi:hypothetical protein